MTDRASLAREWQTALGRTPPNEPTLASLDDDLRVAHARVLLEEALEAVEALGCRARIVGDGSDVTDRTVRVDRFPGRDVDLVQAAHELTDVQYIAETTSVMLGLPGDDLFAVIHRSNMSRILPDGSLLRHPSRTKDPRYVKPDIPSCLARWTTA